MIYLNDLDDKIVVFGMSCVGKTTFAKQLTSHHYYCFDALFHWRDIEVFGLSVSANLAEIRDYCQGKFVLDGWVLADQEGQFLPPQAKVYVIYASYEQIISQYRVKVDDPKDHRQMFHKWYGIDYTKLPGTRYFRNDGEFVETNYFDKV